MKQKVWRYEKLGDLLTNEQLRDVGLIISHEPDSIARVNKLKAYLSPLTQQLEPKDVLPEFLAYAIEHACSEFRTKGKT